MSQNAPKSDRLNPKQARLVLCLLQGLSLNNAAAIVGVSYCTAKRWKDLPAVAEAIQQGTENLINQTQLDLLSKVSSAVGVLHQLAADVSLSAQIRRQAASDIVSLALRSVADHDRRWMVELAREQESIKRLFNERTANPRRHAPPAARDSGPGRPPVPGTNQPDR